MMATACGKHVPRGSLPGRVCTTGDGPDPLAIPVPDGGLMRQVVATFGHGWDPEEAFQECCVARLQALRTFNPDRGKWSTWLHFYCRNRLKSHRILTARRKAMGYPAPQYADDVDFDAVPAPRPAGDTIDVADALRRLPPRHREFVVRTYWHRETLREIAAAHGLSRERVRQVLDDAKDRLRAALADTVPA